MPPKIFSTLILNPRNPSLKPLSDLKTEGKVDIQMSLPISIDSGKILLNETSLLKRMFLINGEPITASNVYKSIEEGSLEKYKIRMSKEFFKRTIPVSDEMIILLWKERKALKELYEHSLEIVPSPPKEKRRRAKQVNIGGGVSFNGVVKILRKKW